MTNFDFFELQKNTESENEEKSMNKNIDSTTDFIKPVISSVVTTGVGAAVGGIPGAVIGALAGTTVEKTIAWAVSEIKGRLLSDNENRRMNTVLGCSIEKIKENITNGKTLRTDNFFDYATGRTISEELLEEMLMTAQKESEERKLKYIANLYGNVIFDTSKSLGENVDRETIINLMKISSELTYRQIVIIAVLGQYQQGRITKPKRRTENLGYRGKNFKFISSETFDLYLKSYITATEIVPYADVIPPSKLSLRGYGVALYNFMELWNLEKDETYNDVVSYFSGVKI